MIDKKTVDVFAMFNDELNSIKKELTQKSVPLPASHPKFAGQAHWAKMLKKGIERSMMVGFFILIFLLLIWFTTSLAFAWKSQLVSVHVAAQQQNAWNCIVHWNTLVFRQIFIYYCKHIPCLQIKWIHNCVSWNKFAALILAAVKKFHAALCICI